jgi:thiol-disulfide isomerase/thioredoxin
MPTVLRTVFAIAALSAATWVSALEIKPYSPRDFAAAQASGRPVALQFHATWCPTCKRQEQALSALQSDLQFKALTLFVADYDEETDLKRRMNVRVQSNVIAFKGRQEEELWGPDPARRNSYLARSRQMDRGSGARGPARRLGGSHRAVLMQRALRPLA